MKKKYNNLKQCFNKGISTPVGILVVLSVAIVAGLLIWQFSPEDEIPSPLSVEIPMPTSTQSSTPSTDSELTSIDSIWDLYTNYKYGFSIKVPKKMFHRDGMCERENDSYRPKGGIVPVKIFEDENIYICGEYFYELIGATIKGYHLYSSGCEKVINSLSRLKDDEHIHMQVWEFVIKTISSDLELENLIKEHYGSGCRLGNKNISSQSGVFDISVLHDGKPLGESKCPITSRIILKYCPAKNKVILWDLGQCDTFYLSGSHPSFYDQEMLDSFKFE